MHSGQLVFTKTARVLLNSTFVCQIFLAIDSSSKELIHLFEWTLIYIYIYIYISLFVFPYFNIFKPSIVLYTISECCGPHTFLPSFIGPAYSRPSAMLVLAGMKTHTHTHTHAHTHTSITSVTRTTQPLDPTDIHINQKCEARESTKSHAPGIMRTTHHHEQLG